MLDLSTEQQYWEVGLTFVAGIDEVGRGCLAGPVVAAAVVFPISHKPIPGVNDSKKLTGKRREFLNKEIRKQTRMIGLGQVEAQVIDEIGIVAATKEAMRQAVLKIKTLDAVVVDGASKMDLNNICNRVDNIVRGDALVYSIAAASIVAKVYRDELMTKLSRLHPEYLWSSNKGYGTKAHIEAMEKLGLSPYHRKSFIVKQRSSFI